MKQKIAALYHFLPVQLLLLHLRKSQLLLIFWVILFLTITQNFATIFGAHTLFLAPEYLNRISFLSMCILGIAMGIYVMAWNITTFIMHSHRIPFMGATKHAFLKYCYNNALLPFLFLSLLSACSVSYQWHEEGFGWGKIIGLQCGFYLGYALTISVSFLYFFRVDKDLLKSTLAAITNPSPVVREFIPYDNLDSEYSRVLPAKTFLNRFFFITEIRTLEAYPHRMLQAVLRRHHRNAIFATLVTLVLLIVLGLFAQTPMLRLPAGAGFLILFAVLIGILGSVKYFLRTWELIGWAVIIAIAAVLVNMGWIDLRSKAYGIKYEARKERKAYNYTELKKLFTPALFEQHRLHAQQWMRNRVATMSDSQHPKPPVVIISVSGGGSRAAYFTFRALQYADSLCGGQLYQHTLLLTGASGGMLGAAYWRAIQAKFPNDKYNLRYQENIGKDLLNAIVFSMATVDAVSPFNKINIGPYRYNKNRGFAMEEELISNTEGLLGGAIGDVKATEYSGKMPALIYCGTILNDSRKLIISPQPSSYLCQPLHTLHSDTNTSIDGIDFATFFAQNDALQLRTATALRISATFPVVLPVIKLPTMPEMNLMDAGMRDNFGIDLALRFINVHKDWLRENTGGVILFQIRDTRAHEVFPPTEQNTLERMAVEPISVMTEKWEPFQSYAQDHAQDLAATAFGDMLKIVRAEFNPEDEDRHIALNFHLTGKEKQELSRAIYHPQVQAAMRKLQKAINPYTFRNR